MDAVAFLAEGAGPAPEREAPLSSRTRSATRRREGIHTYNLVLILTRHTLARAGLANRLY